MLHKTLIEMVFLKGDPAKRIKNNNSSIYSIILVMVAGGIHGLTLFCFRGEALVGELNYYYLVFFILFGYLYMVTSQLGITLMLWAMCRILKGLPKFFTLFSVLGHAILPYGLMVSTLTYWQTLTDPTLATFISLLFAALIFGALFVYSLVKVVALMQTFSYKKSIVCVALLLIFFGSFVYVFGY